MFQLSISNTVSIGDIATFIGFLSAVLTLLGIRNQISVSVFSDYSDRYHQIMRRFPLEVWTNKALRLAELEPNKQHSLKSDFADFFRLLAGERYLHELGFINRQTWRVWARGARQLLSRPISKEIWDELREIFDYDPRFQKYIDSNFR